MANWADQITEFQRNWLEQQQQLMSGWLGTLQGAAGAGTPQSAWQQTIDANEQQINSVLETQQKILTALVKTAEDAGSATLEPGRWEHQAEESIQLWVDLQHRLWKVWFEMLRNASPVQQTPGQLLTKNWQDIVQRALDFQEQCLSTWTGGAAEESAKPARKRSGKASSARPASETAGEEQPKSTH